MRSLRVALFTDSFHQANGVATVSREFARFAERRQVPFFHVHSGGRTHIIQQGSSATVELKRSLAAFPLDYDLYCDPFLSRYKNWITAEVRAFRADLVHITAPGDVGILGFWVAHSIGIPLVASWHTNLHEYAARRLEKLFSFFPGTWRTRISHSGEHQSLRALIRFYGLARFLLAPNEATVQLLQERTGRPAFLMAHGVDTEFYSPARRIKQTEPFCIGYVGRLTPEKDVRLFVGLEQSLLSAGQRNFRFTIVGEGSEKHWLRRNLRFGELPGILRGHALAQAFANIDMFVFPSRTDTFGLVLLEAMASGVPVVVNAETGAQVSVRNEVTGYYAEDLNSLTRSVVCLMQNEPLRRQMGYSARQFACSKNWDGVFEELYQTYERGLELATPLRQQSLDGTPPVLR